MSAAENVARTLHPSNDVVKGKSFASLFDVLNDVRRQSKPEKPALILEFMKLAKMLCAESVTLEDKIYNFMQNYKLLTRDQARKECLSLIKDIQDVYGP